MSRLHLKNRICRGICFSALMNFQALVACADTPAVITDKNRESGTSNVTIVQIPTLPDERKILSTLPSLDPNLVEVAVAFPERFDPDKRYPVLITQVTVDRYLPNIENMEAYRETALANGYVVLTAQGKPWPATMEEDTRQHRYVSLRAALRWLEQQYPASRDWPLVLAGFSGGAKMVQPLAAVLLAENRHVIGLFLGGCNEEFTGEIMKTFPQVRDAYASMDFFLSAGGNDIIAPPRVVRRVARRLEKAGAENVYFSRYHGGHDLNTNDLDKALKWFLSPEPDPASTHR